jgi:hypothetical protein
MSSLLGRLWRRLLGAPSDAGPAASSRDGGSSVLAPPAGFTPRDGEVVHAHGSAHGRDPERGLDLGEGTLLVTTHGIVYFTGAKRWRFPWRGIEQVELEESLILYVETRSGRHFSFRAASAPEAETMRQAATALLEHA